jgi:hypothetical protein
MPRNKSTYSLWPLRELLLAANYRYRESRLGIDKPSSGRSLTKSLQRSTRG